MRRVLFGQKRILIMRSSFLCCLFWTLFASLSATGISVDPMEHFLQPGKTAIYQVTNQTDRTLAVEVSSETWTISEEGEEKSEETRDLLVFPSQFLLKGNTTKRVKVGVRSKEPIDQEKCYRVTIQELPVQFEQEEYGAPQVYIASAFRTSVYVTPKRGVSKLSLEKSSIDEGALSVHLRNEGTVHDYIRHPVLELSFKDGTQKTLENEDALKKWIGQNLHAGSSRALHLDLSQVGCTDEIDSAILRLRNDRGSDAYVFELLL